MEVLEMEESFRNLGLWINGHGDQKADTDRRITDTIAEINRMQRSGLDSTRKFDAIKKVTSIYLNHTFSYVTWQHIHLQAMPKC